MPTLTPSTSTVPTSKTNAKTLGAPPQSSHQSGRARITRAAYTPLCGESIAARLKLAMDATGMTVDRFVRVHGAIDERTVWRWRAGQSTPTLDTLARTCDVLGVSADWLLGRNRNGGPR